MGRRQVCLAQCISEFLAPVALILVAHNPFSSPAADTAVGSPIGATSSVTCHPPGRCQRHTIGADAGCTIRPVRADTTDIAAILTADQTTRNDQEARAATQTIGASAGVCPG